MAIARIQLAPLAGSHDRGLGGGLLRRASQVPRLFESRLVQPNRVWVQTDLVVDAVGAGRLHALRQPGRPGRFELKSSRS